MSKEDLISGEQRKITFSVDRTQNFPEWYQDVLKVADIVDDRYPLKGASVWKPYGYKSLKLMLRIIEHLLDETGHEEVYFPLLVPESIFRKEKDFLKGFGGESYVVTHAGDAELTEKLYLRPTSEAPMYEMIRLWIISKSDLPMKIYQTINVFRYETKQTKPLLRVREIVKFKEAHTLHATKEDADKQISEGVSIYKQFFDTLLIPYIVIKTPSWDTFAGAEYNFDLMTVMPDGKAIELGSVINLGTKFAKAFDIKYQKEDGSYEHAYQTCYGISERALGVCFSVHGDNRGLIIPPIVAPIQVIIIPILFKGKEKSVLDKSYTVLDQLRKNGIRVDIDDSEKTSGDKFYRWEAKGVPIRIEIGPKDVEKHQVVIVRRDTFQKVFVDENDVFNRIENTMCNMTRDLKQKGGKYLLDRIFHYDTVDQLKNNYKERLGVVTLPWCSNERCGKSLSEIIDIPALGYDPDCTSNGIPCALCGIQENTKSLFFGRTY